MQQTILTCDSFAAVERLLRGRRGGIERQGECWVWTGYARNGYGSVRVPGKNEYLHLLVYRALTGPIPAGWQVDHLCRVRRCLRPKHLEAVMEWVNKSRQNDARGRRREYIGKGKGSVMVYATNYFDV